MALFAKIVRGKKGMRRFDFIRVSKRSFRKYCSKCDNLEEVLKDVPYCVILKPYNIDRCFKYGSYTCFRKRK